MNFNFNEPYTASLDIELDLQEGAWSGIHPARIGRLVKIGTITHGTESGRPVVAMLLYADGVEEPILTYTTLDLFVTAARAMEARHSK